MLYAIDRMRITPTKEGRITFAVQNQLRVRLHCYAHSGLFAIRLLDY